MDKLIEYLLNEIKANSNTIKNWDYFVKFLMIVFVTISFGIIFKNPFFNWLEIKNTTDIKDFSISLLYISGFLFLLSFFIFTIKKSADGERDILIQRFREINSELFDKIRDRIINFKRIEERPVQNFISYWVKKDRVVEFWIKNTGFEFRFKKEFI